MKVLELFAGSRSFSKVAEKYGFDTYTTDIEPFEGIDQVCDIRAFDELKMIREWGYPDIIWASPPCTSFSVASIGHHWKGGSKAYVPKTDSAKLGILLVKHMRIIISVLDPKFYIIENPRGLLRKLNLIEGEPVTAWYCQYGDDRAKPTDFWTNFYWTPKACKNGNPDCHHQPAPRGSRTGTQGLKNAYERSKIPKKLCEDIIKTIKEINR